MSIPSVLIIGCGSIGERHLRCFQKTGRCRVTACDVNPTLRQKMVDTYGVPAVADAAAAIAGGGHEAVVICTPGSLHIPQALAALGAGCHVLIEKPLSVSLAGVDELLTARDRSGRQAAVAYVYRVFPFLAAAHEFLTRGEFGPVRHVAAVSGQPFHLFRPAYAQIYYRDRATGGGAIQDALTHVANWVESVVGPTASVLCDCAHLSLPGVTVEDTVAVNARQENGVHVHYSLNQFQAPNENTIQFNAGGGSVKIEIHRQRWGTYAARAADWIWHDTPVLERDAHFIAQANAFLDQIEGRPPRLCSLEAAAQTLRFNLAALAAAERGTRVQLRDL